MKEFKVGDWVTLLDKWVHKVEAVSKNGRVLFLNTREIPQADNWWDIDQCTPWQPEIGEWCWFWEIDSNPKLCQYSKYINGEYEALSIDPYYELEGHFGFCEPFIGELPSFIKERSCNQLT